MAKLWRYPALVVDVLYAAAAGCWAVLVPAFVLAILVRGEFADYLVKAPFFFVDFFRLYVFAKIAVSSDNHAIYDPGVQGRWADKILAPALPGQIFYSEMPPYTAPLLFPLALLPAAAACGVWIVFLLSVVVVSLAWLTKALRRPPVATSAAIIASTLASVPGLWATVLGQLNWLMLALSAVFYLLLMRRKDLLAGICLALTSVKPQYFVFLAPAALAGKRLKLIAFACITELALLLLGAAMIGWESVASYPNVLAQVHSTGWLNGFFLEDFARDTQYTVSARRLLACVLPPQAAALAGFLLLALALVAVALVWQKAWQRGEDSCRAWAMSLTILVFLVASPHCHSHDCVALALPALLTLPAAGVRHMGAVRSADLRIWAVLLYVYSPIAWVLFFLLERGSFIWSMFFLTMNLLLLVIGYRCFREALR